MIIKNKKSGLIKIIRNEEIRDVHKFIECPLCGQRFKYSRGFKSNYWANLNQNQDVIICKICHEKERK